MPQDFSSLPPPLTFEPVPADGVGVELTKLLATRLLVVGNSGSGKSHALRLLLEDTAPRVVQVVLDPEGEFYTLRQAHPYVHVGVGADVDPNVATAAALAQGLVRAGASSIVDLSELTREDRDAYAAAYVRGLIDLPAADRRHVLLVVDEAQTLAPEGPTTDAGRALIDAATRGRKRGLGLVCATQRLALLDKSLVSQLTGVLVGRTALGNDQRRAADVLGFSTRQRRQLGELNAGEFFAFGPAFVQTVDNQAAPLGEVTRVVTASDTATRHPSASDLSAPDVPTPAALADLIAELRQLETSADVDTSSSGSTEDPTAVDRLLGQLARAERERDDLRAEFDRYRGWVHDRAIELANAHTDLLAAAFATEQGPGRPKTRPERTQKPPERTQTKAGPSAHVALTPPGERLDDRLALPAAQRRILDTLASMEAVGLAHLDRRNLAVFSRQSPKSSAYGAHVASLAEAELVHYPTGGAVALTEAGRQLAAYEGAPESLQQLHERWLGYLDVQPRTLLDRLIGERYETPSAPSMSRENLADATGYSAKSSAFGAAIAELASLGLVVYPSAGRVSASDLLFPSGLS